MPFTVADYILKRLSQHQVDTLFGVPAAYGAPLFDAVAAHDIKPVVTATDLEAGYAADGYARTKGLGVASVANGVGVLSMINAIAGAFVERSPVVVVNGGPNAANLTNLKDFDVLFSHSTGQPDGDLNAYRLVTASAARAERTADVPALVDNAISTAIRRKRPVYIEVNRAIWTEDCTPPDGSLPVANPAVGTEQQLATTIIELVRAATKPVLLVGLEIQRYGLADTMADLIAKLGIRWSAQVPAKSALSEEGDGWVGIFAPPSSLPTAIQEADLIVMLGCVFPSSYASFIRNRTNDIVTAYDGKIKIKAGTKQDADIRALMTALVAEAAKQAPRPVPAAVDPAPPPAAGPLTYAQVFDRVGAALNALNALNDSWLVIPDTFLGSASAANLPVKGRDGYLSGAVWASIGHSVAAAVGASFGSKRRPLVICGDGGFHTTAQALSTFARYCRNAVVLVIDNGIYGLEQYIIDSGYYDDPDAAPKPYVVLNPWDFTKFAHGVGIRSTYSVDTAAELDRALDEAKDSAAPALIVAKVSPRSLPAQLP
ncbi:thiamine pyrophosphate-dependent enzyme [Nonomuraea sp. NPDC050202]|uniref:thiamine pyrophosphate-dependent enzyme n=1 Tax=Nonomuraea sp. NPDC050202 TaxID=3155035 RepID=UPI0033EEF1B5